MTLRSKMAARFLVLAAIPLLLTSFLSGYLIWQNKLVSPEEARLYAVGKTLEQRGRGRIYLPVVRKAAGYMNEQLVSVRESLLSLSKKSDLIGAKVNPKTQQTLLNGFLANYSEFRMVQVLSDRGRVIAGAPKKYAGLGQDLRGSPDLKALARAKNSFAMGPVRWKGAPGPEQSLMVRFRKEGRRATLIATLNMKRFLGLYAEGSQGLEAFLLSNSKLRYLAHTRPEMAGNWFNKLRIPHLDTAQDDIKAKAAGYVLAYQQGRDVVMAYAPVRGSDFSIGIVEDIVTDMGISQDMALPSIDELSGLIGEPLVFIPLCFFFITLLLAFSVSGPAVAALDELRDRLDKARDDEDVLMAATHPEAKKILDPIRDLLNHTREEMAQTLHEKEVALEALRSEAPRSAASNVETGDSGYKEEKEKELEAMRVLVQTLREENERLASQETALEEDSSQSAGYDIVEEEEEADSIDETLLTEDDDLLSDEDDQDGPGDDESGLEDDSLAVKVEDEDRLESEESTDTDGLDMGLDLDSEDDPSDSKDDSSALELSGDGEDAEDVDLDSDTENEGLGLSDEPPQAPDEAGNEEVELIDLNPQTEEKAPPPPPSPPDGVDDPPAPPMAEESPAVLDISEFDDEPSEEDETNLPPSLPPEPPPLSQAVESDDPPEASEMPPGELNFAEFDEESEESMPEPLESLPPSPESPGSSDPNKKTDFDPNLFED